MFPLLWKYVASTLRDKLLLHIRYVTNTAQILYRCLISVSLAASAEWLSGYDRSIMLYTPLCYHHTKKGSYAWLVSGAWKKRVPSSLCVANKKGVCIVAHMGLNDPWIWMRKKKKEKIKVFLNCLHWYHIFWRAMLDNVQTFFVVNS